MKGKSWPLYALQYFSSVESLQCATPSQTLSALTHLSPLWHWNCPGRQMRRAAKMRISFVFPIQTNSRHSLSSSWSQHWLCPSHQYTLLMQRGSAPPQRICLSLHFDSHFAPSAFSSKPKSTFLCIYSPFCCLYRSNKRRSRTLMWCFCPPRVREDRDVRSSSHCTDCYR